MNDEKHEKTPPESGVAPDSRMRVILWGSIGAGALLGFVFALAMPATWLLVPQKPEHAHEGEVAQDAKSPKEFYACPMFCTRLDKPGTCPVCGMDMELFVDTGARMPLDGAIRKSMSLETEAIETRMLAKEITTLGNFEPDETRQKVVAAWVDGRIEKLYADFTGIPVEKGWHLFDLYSPDLYAAQKELIVAREATEREGVSETGKREAERLLENSREKLRLLGLAEDQVAYIETLDKPNLTLTIPSPDAGVVTQKYAHVGMYVKQGQPVFRVTDLSRLWLIVEVHERDLGFIALGQKVGIKVNAYPGRTFEGDVGFIDPALDMTTRTVRVRVEVPNEENLLKPGMYGEATIFAELGQDAELAKPELKGDYACPMHPLERASDGTATCDICGMRMVKHDHDHGGKARKLWAIPREAVMSTGDRQIIYIEWWVRETDHPPHSPDEDPDYEMLHEPEYQGFSVELGPLAAEYHIMEDGTRHKLREYYPMIGGLPTGIRMPDGEIGWRIVTNGQFLIDSQMELTGKPSLLRPDGGEKADPHAGH
ncbi:MAG: efflux RND transporter periplasmic adaptor subunit [Planctomycetes bacterium]|nr:efflux RND transporter periplasmic adaptor subunit [Planctomycetota bacterium]